MGLEEQEGSCLEKEVLRPGREGWIHQVCARDLLRRETEVTLRQEKAAPPLQVASLQVKWSLQVARPEHLPASLGDERLPELAPIPELRRVLGQGMLVNLLPGQGHFRRKMPVTIHDEVPDRRTDAVGEKRNV